MVPSHHNNLDRALHDNASTPIWRVGDCAGNVAICFRNRSRIFILLGVATIIGRNIDNLRTFSDFADDSARKSVDGMVRFVTFLLLFTLFLPEVIGDGGISGIFVILSQRA